MTLEGQMPNIVLPLESGYIASLSILTQHIQ